MGADLRSFLAGLPAEELITVSRPVAPGAELSSVVKATEPAGAPGVLFTEVEGSELPVLMGLFGTRDRVARALGVPADEALEHVLRVQHGAGLPEPVVLAPENAPVQQNVRLGDEASLAALPLATHSRADAGAYITSGVVLARDPRTGTVNTGMYRLMITGDRTLTVNAAPDHDLGRIFSAAREAGQTVPVAIVIGHHPLYAIGSQLKNPVAVDAHRLVGGLLGEPLEVVPARTIDLDVPAGAEIVIEGVVDPADRQGEGPFGEFSYYYGSAQAPVCTVTAITRRDDAIFNDLHPTHSEHLCLWLFPGREARLLEAVRRSVPGVQAVRIPFSGSSFSAYVSVSKRKEGDGKQAILAAFAADHFLKHVYVVDDDIDLRDDERVLWALNVRFQADRDLMRLEAARGIRMDPSARQFTTPFGTDTTTAKLGFDATRPVEGFPERADLPHPGFEHVNLADYLSTESLADVHAMGAARARMRE
jgi:2,5-furandicarboxylate decarboxylase 1